MFFSEIINLTKLYWTDDCHIKALLAAVSKKGIEKNYNSDTLIKKLYIDHIGYQEKDKMCVASFSCLIRTSALHLSERNMDLLSIIKSKEVCYKGDINFPILPSWRNKGANTSFIEKEVIAVSRKGISDFITINNQEENSRANLVKIVDKLDIYQESSHT